MEDEHVQGMLMSPGDRYRKSGFFQMSDDLDKDAKQV